MCCFLMWWLRLPLIAQIADNDPGTLLRAKQTARQRWPTTRAALRKGMLQLLPCVNFKLVGNAHIFGPSTPGNRRHKR